MHLEKITLYNTPNTVKYVLFLFAIFISTNSAIQAQENPDAKPLEYKKSFWKGVYVDKDGDALTLKEAQDLMQSVPSAHDEMKKARTNHALDIILSAVAGGMIGHPIGVAIRGDKPNWIFAGVGVGLIGVVVHLYNAKIKRTKNAVALYNKAKGYETAYPVEFNIGVSGNGVGLTVSF